LVVAALCSDGKNVLITQRLPDRPLPLLWELPGGKVEPGESPVAALVREIDEELDCQVEVGAIYDVVFHSYPAFDLVMLVYLCRLDPTAIRAQEIAAWEWVPVSELPTRQLLPADMPLARQLAQVGLPEWRPAYHESTE
jgi:8-oxo-dGTP diphosphatase